MGIMSLAVPPPSDRLCTAPTLEALIPRLVQLIKRGVGLNTRCGAANFVVQLTTRHGADMKAHTAVLIKVRGAPHPPACYYISLMTDPAFCILVMQMHIR